MNPKNIPFPRLAPWVVASLLAMPASLPAQAAPGAAGAPVAQAPQAPAATAAPAPASKPMMPDVISTYGEDVDYLFYLISAITGVMFVLVTVLFILFVVRYRYREGRKTIYTHGNNKLEITWSVATAAILLFLVFAQKSTWDEIKQKDLKGLKDPFLVRVFAEQFVWHFVYPGADGKFEPSDVKNVFVGVNPVGLKNADADVYSGVLMVPEDRDVIVELNSIGKYDQDTGKETLPVLHSFFSPNLRLKHDIVPFYPQEVWFHVKPGKRGNYELVCAELCGLGHYTMRADFKVLGDDELVTALGYDWKANLPQYPDAFPQ